MKKFEKVNFRSSLILLFAFIFLIAFSFTAQSAKFISEQNSNLTGQEIDSNIYITGKNVLVNATARRDITGLCQSFNLLKTVFGDITLACSFISVNAPVNGDIRIAGQEVLINYDINGEAMIFANKALIKGVVYKDLNLFASEAIINGTIKGPAHIEADKLIINGIFESDAIIDAESITLGPDAAIKGNFNYSGELKNPISDKVKGKIIELEKQSEFSFNQGTWLWNLVFSYLIFLAVGMLLITVAKEPIQKGVQVLEEKYFWSFIIGLCSFLVIPVLIIFLIITIIGIPIAIIILFLFAIILFVARMYFIIMLGQRLFPMQNEFIQFSIALLFFALISSIPGVGWIFLAIATTLGIGVMFFVVTEKKKKRKKRY